MKIIVAGGSGLVGTHLMSILLGDERVTQVTSVARASLERKHAKLVERIATFDALETIPLAGADCAFCALGSTIKKAGSREAFFRIDHDFVISFARACRASGVRRFGLVSAHGADAESSIFYSQVKGKAELDLQQLEFERFVIVRPSLILGARAERRPLETFAQNLGRVLAPFLVGPLAAVRPVEASLIAKSLAAAVLDDGSPNGLRVIENHEIAEFKGTLPKAERRD